jgi:transcriptional regulator with XRE-family HTH domain
MAGPAAVDPYRRSREIGAALARARQRMGRTQEECAQYIGTTRKRYSAIERGTSLIAAVELELLVAYIEIPPLDVWPAELLVPHTQRVNAKPGESVLIVIDPFSNRDGA